MSVKIDFKFMKNKVKLKIILPIINIDKKKNSKKC